MSRNMQGLQPYLRVRPKLPTASPEERAFMNRALRLARYEQQRKANTVDRATNTLQRELNAAYLMRQRAIRATILPKLTKTEWEEIKVIYFHRCYYCLQPGKLTKDHVVPLSKGGQHTKSNIVPACQPCNSRKGNRPAERYRPFTN